MASKGYPYSYDNGYVIEGLDGSKDNICHMGTKLEDNVFKTNGGRVLLVLGKGDSLEKAREDAYTNVNKIKCKNLVYRNDIGHKGLTR
jgi:phosphoribosylamine--glycine ligase